MNKNIGGVERIFRVLIGLGIMSLAFAGLKSPWAFLGAAPLLTGLIGWSALCNFWPVHLPQAQVGHRAKGRAKDSVVD